MKPRPECEKMAKVQPKSQAIGEFLEWLKSEKGLEFAQYHKHTDDCEDGEDCEISEEQLMPVFQSTEKLLAEFFEIDLNKVEDERRALLRELSNASK